MFLKGEGFNIDDGLDPVVALATMKKNGQDAALRERQSQDSHPGTPARLGFRRPGWQQVLRSR